MAAVSELPQVLMQYIQYILFPNLKDANRTVILSKAWRDAWYDHPNNIYLDESTFNGTRGEFRSHMRNTFELRLEQKLCVHAFKLRLLTLDSVYVSLLNAWIPKIVHMGVKMFHLNLTDTNAPKYYLPQTVFRVKSIVKLSLKGCRLDHASDVDIKFDNLKILRLFDVYVSEATFQGIISKCPFIQELELVRCEGLRGIKLKNNYQRLQNSEYWLNEYQRLNSEYRRIVENLTSITICDYEDWFHGQIFKRFYKLNNLSLTNVHLSVIFFSIFADFFPCLEYLTLDGCHGFEEMFRISSHSITHISLTGMGHRSIKGGFIDAPNIRRFVYSGNMPSIVSFQKSNSTWISDINLQFYDHASLKWFKKANEMLEELSQSEISLTISQPLNFELKKVDDVHFKPVEVESLRFGFCDISAVNNLFFICHPKIVDMYWDGEEFAEYVYRTLMERRNTNTGKFREIWQNDLKEVISLNIYDNNLREWRGILPLGTSLRKCALPNDQYPLRICLELKWTEVVDYGDNEFEL